MEIQFNREAIQLLEEIPMFSDFTVEERAELAAAMDRHAFEANHVIWREKEEGRDLFVIGRGKVEVRKNKPHGNGDVLITSYERGGVLGEMAIVDHQPRSATLVTVEPTEVYMLPGDVLEEMVLDDHRRLMALKIFRAMARLLSLKLRETSGMFADVL